MHNEIGTSMQSRDKENGMDKRQVANDSVQKAPSCQIIKFGPYTGIAFDCQM